MRVNHIDLQVSDVDAAREFFERFFGLRCRYQAAETDRDFRQRYGFRVRGEQFVQLTAAVLSAGVPPGFALERTSEVREVYERLKPPGVEMKLDLGIQGPALVFQCLGPDAIPVEVRAPKDS